MFDTKTEYVARIGVINSVGSLLTLTGAGYHNKHEDSGYIYIDRRSNADIQDINNQKGMKGLKAILDTKASSECSCYEHLISTSESIRVSRNRTLSYIKGINSATPLEEEEYNSTNSAKSVPMSSLHPIHSLTAKGREKAVMERPNYNNYKLITSGEESQIICFISGVILAILVLQEHPGQSHDQQFDGADNSIIDVI